MAEHRDPPHSFKSGAELSDNGWQFWLVEISSGESVRVFLNGNLVGSNSLKLNSKNTSTPFFTGQLVGRRGSGGRGRIDDLRIYDRALTKEEVGALYEYERVPDTTIELQPLDQVVTLGDSATFRVEAKNESDEVNLGYQWFRNEEAIEGATDTQLSLEDVSMADAGNYKVIVSGGFEPVSSEPFVRVRETF